MKIIFASQNPNKITEIRAKLPDFTIEGLDPKVFPNELLETGDTLEDNALQKVRQVFEKTQASCFADDTGLEVDALDGKPGVYSARYAGEQRSSCITVYYPLAARTSTNIGVRTVARGICHCPK